MPHKVNLKKLNTKDLKALISDASKEIEAKAKEEKAKAKAAAAAAAKKFGFSLDELTGGKSKAKSTGTAKPKYANPDDKSQKWSGRGRQPAWFKDKIEKGTTPDDMLI